ncbi:MAG: magnesium chelatase subunit D [Pseudomonadota bacterium]
MSPGTAPNLAADSTLAAALIAVDPAGLGGVALRAGAGPERDEWLALLRRLLPEGTPWRRVPININDAALLGGLDLGATLQAGRPVAQQGVLAQADGGVVLLAMAERLTGGVAARLAAVLDSQEVVIERDGLALRRAARLGVVALDEGAADDEQMPAALMDRMAFHLRLADGSPADGAVDWQRHDVDEARALLPQVTAGDAILQALCAAALALGVASLRAPLLALRAARAAAALAGMDEVDESHAAIAARLVLAPRATQMPVMQADEESAAGQPPDQAPPEPPPEAADETAPEPPPSDAAGQTPPEPPADPARNDEADRDDPLANKELAEAVLEAARAAIPPGLLAMLKLSEANRSRMQAAGRAGAAQKGQARGRPIGARRGEPRAGARLNIIETLRAAAPWQRLRRQQVAAAGQAAAIAAVSSSTAVPARLTAVLAPGKGDPAALQQRIHVRREDFHVTRMRQLGQTTTVFVVDASGSSALHRLAEAKGAVELLLADCYVRRDRVSVLAFRGKSAELLLPPTRSLARAKRSLAALPGGGGTPLASAIDAAVGLAGQIVRRGETPIIVLLTDGRGNIARNGAPGRVQANEDALASARQLCAAGLTALLLDTSPQPQPAAQLLAATMGAAYVPLPHAGAQAMAKVVSQVGRMGSAAGPR